MEGDLTWLKNPQRRRGLYSKLNTDWKEPYRIVKKINDIVDRVCNILNGDIPANFDSRRRIAPTFGVKSSKGRRWERLLDYSRTADSTSTSSPERIWANSLVIATFGRHCEICNIDLWNWTSATLQCLEMTAHCNGLAWRIMYNKLEDDLLQGHAYQRSHLQLQPSEE